MHSYRSLSAFPHWFVGLYAAIHAGLSANSTDPFSRRLFQQRFRRCITGTRLNEILRCLTAIRLRFLHWQLADPRYGVIALASRRVHISQRQFTMLLSRQLRSPRQAADFTAKVFSIACGEEARCHIRTAQAAKLLTLLRDAGKQKKEWRKAGSHPRIEKGRK